MQQASKRYQKVSNSIPVAASPLTHNLPAVNHRFSRSPKKKKNSGRQRPNVSQGEVKASLTTVVSTRETRLVLPAGDHRRTAARDTPSVRLLLACRLAHRNGQDQ